MPGKAQRKTRDELLREIQEAYELRHARAKQLLENIKQHKPVIVNLLTTFIQEEPDLVYRFYHQSFKVFVMNRLIMQANNLFEGFAPESTKLNSWYLAITEAAMKKEFDVDKTNSNWLDETLPITQGFWHAKYFLEQMIIAADELDEAPQSLPSGWAAILYLYNLR